MIGNLETLAWSGAIGYVVAILIGCNDVGDRPPKRNSPSADGGGAPAVGGNGNVAGASRLDPAPSKPPAHCTSSFPARGRRCLDAGFACGFGTEVLSTKGGPSLDWVVHEDAQTQLDLQS
jgi:hypothetical protein